MASVVTTDTFIIISTGLSITAVSGVTCADMGSSNVVTGSISVTSISFETFVDVGASETITSISSFTSTFKGSIDIGTGSVWITWVSFGSTFIDVSADISGTFPSWITSADK